jgi:hypothetical protein
MKIYMSMLFLSLILLGCSSETSLFNSTQFVNELAKTNLNYNVVENDEKIPFFSVPPKVVDVKGEYILIFEYKTHKEMEKEASNVKEDGNMRNASIEYVSVPHYFKKGSIIIQYVGADEEILKSLEKIMGKQFAGR